MAAIITSIIGELGTLIGGEGLGSTLGRGALAGVGAVAASDLLKAIQADLAPGSSPAAKGQARRVPQYAIVDLHTNKVVRFLSVHKVYVMLTQKRHRGRRRSPRIITVPSGAQIVEVK